MVLGAAQGLDPLAVAGSLLVDVAGDRGRAHERYGGNIGVGNYGAHRHLVAVNHVEHPVGKAGLGQQFGVEQGRRRVLLGRLQYEGVPAGDGDREHPHRHHGGEVERGDPGRHAQRLAYGVGVDRGADLFGELPFEEVGDVAGELHHFEAPLHFAEGVVEGLAVFGGEGTGQVQAVPGDQFPVGEHDVLAAGERHRAPVFERLPSRADGLVHLFGGGEGHLGGLPPGGRIEHRTGPLRFPFPGLALDPMGYGFHRFLPCPVGPCLTSTLAPCWIHRRVPACALQRSSMVRAAS